MKQKSIQKNTLGMFDLLKGITMILIIYFHNKSIFPMIENYHYIYGNKPAIIDIPLFVLFYIYSHSIEFLPGAFMPALMIIGGYGYRKRSIAKAFSHQGKELLLPYFYTMIASGGVMFCLHYVIFRLIKGALKESIKQLGGMALGFSQTKEIGNLTLYANGPVWYLLALFWALAVFNVLHNYFDGKWLFFSAFIISMIGWGLSYSPYMPFCLAQGLVSVIYIFFGYYLKKEKWFLRKHSGKEVLFGLVGVIVPNYVLSHLNLYTSLALNHYSLGPVTYIENGLLGVLVIYVFLKLNVYKGKIIGSMRTVGRYSLFVVCVHTVEMVALPWYLFVERFSENPYAGCIILFFIRLVIIFVVSIGLVKLSNYKKKQKYAKRKTIKA